MFNLGSDDKEDLQENMKEIKNLIDNRGSKQPAQNQGADDSGFGDSPQSNQESPSNSNQFEQKVRQNAQQERNNNPSEDGFGQDLSVKDKGEGLQSNQGRQQTDNELGQRNNQATQSGGLGSSHSEASQPSNDKVINEEDNQQNSQPEAEAQESRSSPSGNEPLFLREEQFTDIREMIEEMSYLTQEMGQKVDRMKKTVRDERDTSKDSSELVEAFNQRRAKIRSTIESGQN